MTTIPKIFLTLTTFVLCALTAGAQPRFRVSPSEEHLIEGGTINILAIQTDKERFTLQLPRNYGMLVHESDQSITFTSENGTSVITLKLTTNYAGKLPKKDDLRDIVAKKYPTASFAQATPCHTGYGDGWMYEFFQPTAGNLTRRIKDGFVAFPEGSFEFTFACDSRDYDQNRLSFAWLLNSFRLLADTDTKTQ